MITQPLQANDISYIFIILGLESIGKAVPKS